MSNDIGDLNRLYNLMPSLYRERDEREGFPLRDLLRIVTEQADIVHSDIQLLWDNFFIETCERWAIPYIGDLVSNNLLHDAQSLKAPDTARDLFPDLTGPDLRPTNAIRTRADVAKTIYYRRRKGTLPMLEELARDVTGWAAHAVEFFELLIWNQNLNHLRLHSTGCPDLRSPEAVDRLNGPFDFMSHTVDVRFPRQDEGWYNIRNIGFFLWRLRAYRMENVVARQGALPWQFHFSPLGNRAPLFSRLRREGDEAGLATEFHVPGPIRPAAFFTNPDEFYGLTSNNSMLVIRDGVAVPVAQIRCRDLATWAQPIGTSWALTCAAAASPSVPRLSQRRASMCITTTASARIWVEVRIRARNGWSMPTCPPLRLTVLENGPAPHFPTLNDAINALGCPGPSQHRHHHPGQPQLCAQLSADAG